MAAVLARPTDTASIQAHLSHFLRFVVEAAPKVGAHHQLLIETLRYLLSMAQKPLYEVRIQTALNTVSNVVPRKQSGETVSRILDEFSVLYKDLMDRVILCTDGSWLIPPANSNPSIEVMRMNQIWEATREQLRFASVWDLTPK